MKRLLASVLLGSACLFAHAQSPAYTTVQTSFQNLRTNDSIWLKMDARNELGKKFYDYTINLYWLRTLDKAGNTIYKLESSSTDAGGLVRRIVGDGKTFWVYEAPSNTYSSEIYWPEGANQPATYQSQLLQAFSRATRGSESFLSRFIQEVYAGAQANYRPWVVADPSNTYLVPEKSSFQDPMDLNNKAAKYTTGPNQEIALFWAGMPNQNAHRCAAFYFDIDNVGNRTLRTIEYRDIVANSPWRYDSFRIDVYSNITPAANNFIFVPPTNARAVVNTRPGIG